MVLLRLLFLFFLELFLVVPGASNPWHQSLLIKNTLPEVVTAEAVQITSTSAVLAGKVVSDGGTEVFSRGLYWGTEPDPVVNGTQVSLGEGLGVFNHFLESLQPNTQYFFVIFATNVSGTSYGEVKFFRTLAELPQVGTGEAVNITSNSATLAGKIISDGNAPITSRGVYWSTDPDPITFGEEFPMGEGPGTFSALLTGILPNTDYFFAAYATNMQGISYGEIRPFRTLAELPNVITSAPAELNSTSARLGGRIASDGGAEVWERGVIYWAKNDSLNTVQTIGLGEGNGSFSTIITDLQPNKNYYVIAYGTNDEGTNYGLIEPFKTLIEYPEIYTLEPQEITYSSALLFGEVISEGGSPVFERGIFWGKDSNPEISGKKIIEGQGMGLFSVPLEQLESNTTYYYVAFAENERGLRLGNILDFITKEKPLEVFIPNAIMPSSHLEANKTFKPNFGITPSNYSLAIYNRWGSKIFESDSTETGWDGKTTNEDAPAGSYFYRVNYVNEEGQESERRGSFTLIR